MSIWNFYKALHCSQQYNWVHIWWWTIFLSPEDAKFTLKIDIFSVKKLHPSFFSSCYCFIIYFLLLLLIILLLLLFIENAHSFFERAFPHERSPIWNVANCPVLCAERMRSAILRNHLKHFLSGNRHMKPKLCAWVTVCGIAWSPDYLRKWKRWSRVKTCVYFKRTPISMSFTLAEYYLSLTS